jgi:hypothetical protein
MPVNGLPCKLIALRWLVTARLDFIESRRGQIREAVARRPVDTLELHRVCEIDLA